MSTMGTSTTQSAPNPSSEQHEETLLTDDVLERVKEVALDELPGGTIVGVEAGADGAGYLAHMLNADGTPTEVYIDASFDFVELS